VETAKRRSRLSTRSVLDVPHWGTAPKPTGENPLSHFNQNLLGKSTIFPTGLSGAKRFFDTLISVIPFSIYQPGLFSKGFSFQFAYTFEKYRFLQGGR